ncbi:hypothetical protein K523DRAFT_324946 [Schizophyllum commune Tattone D]|nr:hypothetical protein K523DRAFT_324946 [Schizophyllum commune Tattone D]
MRTGAQQMLRLCRAPSVTLRGPDNTSVCAIRDGPLRRPLFHLPRPAAPTALSSYITFPVAVHRGDVIEPSRRPESSENINQPFQHATHASPPCLYIIHSSLARCSFASCTCLRLPSLSDTRAYKPHPRL